MEQVRDKRRPAVILAADIVGYSRLMDAGESGPLAWVETYRQQLIDPKIEEYGGDIVKTTVDGLLVEFPSVLGAVQCAVVIQRAMAKRNDHAADDKRIEFRMGINQGDLIGEDDDIHGDAINVASRLEGLAEPGGICISARVHEDVVDKLGLQFVDLGDQNLENIARPVRAFVVKIYGTPGTPPTGVARGVTTRRGRIMPAIATTVVVIALVGGGLSLWQPWTTPFEVANVANMALPLPDKPSIAILPFDNRSEAESDEYFADGMTDDLIAGLSEISGLFVIGRTSSFTFKGKQTKLGQVAEVLGVRYVLEGSVRRSGDRVRMDAQLTDTTTGARLWAERYEEKIEDIFALQQQVIERIALGLAVILTAAEQQLVNVSETDSVEAYEAFLQGWQHYRRLTPEGLSRAVVFLDRAIELDPEYGRAYAALSLSHSAILRWFDATGLRRFALRTEILNGVTGVGAITNARVALEKSPTSTAYRANSWLSLVGRRYENAVTSARRAVTLAPNDPEGHVALGAALLLDGKPAQAKEAVESAIRLDPHHPSHYLYWLGLARFHLEEFEAAAPLFEADARRNPNGYAIAPLAATYAYLDRDEDARLALNTWTEQVVELFGVQLSLGLMQVELRFRREEDSKRLIDGWRRAGLPE